MGGINGFVFVWFGNFCKIRNCLTWNILPLFNCCSVPDVALDREVEGCLLLGDMGQGVPFRPGTFDGCVRWRTKSLLIFVLFSFILTKDFLHLPAVFLPCSGSVMLTRGHTVLQRDSTDSSVLCIHLWWSHFTLLDHKHQYLLLNNISTFFFFCLSVKRLTCCFSTLSRKLRTGDTPAEIKAHFNWYSYTYSHFSSPLKLELITTQAMKAGFSGGMVVDYPNSSKAKKSVATGSFNHHSFICT